MPEEMTDRAKGRSGVPCGLGSVGRMRRNCKQVQSRGEAGR